MQRVEFEPLRGCGFESLERGFEPLERVPRSSLDERSFKPLRGW
jgi:hypothetical protein